MMQPNDKFERGDRLRVYEPETMKLRFVARADAVNSHKREVIWEKEIGANNVE
jgi:hypothetical protein